MQRTIVYGIAIALFTITVGTVPAQNRNAVADALEAEGYTIVEEYFDGGVPSWRLQDTQGRRFSVSVMGRFSPAHAEALEAMREVIYEIDGLQIERLRYVFESDQADAVVIPSEFVIEGVDYVEYMPSGMQFEFDDAVRFDFRLLVDNLAVRMNGQFLSEAQFLDRIQRAVDNPANYIQSQDPQFLAQQIVDLRERMEQRVAVDADQNTRDQEILSRVESLAQESEAALDSTVEQLTTMGEQAVSRLEAMGERTVNRFEEQIADLEEQQARRMAEMTEAFETQLQALQEEKAQLQSEFEALRRGSIILASRTLFGNLRNVSPETILQAVQIRAADPSLTTDEVRDQVNADLPEEAEPLHNKHIQAIFALYFNEYE
jgi:hypothetical protein